MKLRIQKIDNKMLYFRITNSDTPPRQPVLLGIDPKGVFRWTLPPHTKIKLVEYGKIAVED